ncbi:hypothetical protein [Xenorhabdus siamensis]|uniref:hypothetical protein n=1 Tax=Xenorhabdus siamensis TaxID=3136254 RepID=UPI0030F452DA
MQFLDINAYTIVVNFNTISGFDSYMLVLSTLMPSQSFGVFHCLINQAIPTCTR